MSSGIKKDFLTSIYQIDPSLPAILAGGAGASPNGSAIRPAMLVEVDITFQHLFDSKF